MNASTRLLVTSALASACLSVCGLAQAQATSSGSSSTTTGTGASSYGTSSNVGSPSVQGRTGASVNASGADLSSSTTGAANDGSAAGSANPAAMSSGGMSGTMNQGAAGTGSAAGWDSSNAGGTGVSGTTGSTSGAAGTTGYDSSASSSSTTADTASGPLTYDPPAAGGGYGSGTSYSWLPYTTRGYVGINVGQAKYEESRCVAGFDCDDTSDRAFKVYTGGMFNEFFGLEVAYINTGSVERAGGDTKAHGLNVSLTGQVPINGDMAAVFAKVGGTYGWTKTETNALSGAPEGDESGGGVSYGVGARVNFNANWAIVLEWERHEFKFEGDRDDDVTLTTLGVQYRF